MKKQTDIIKVIWICFCAILCVFGAIYFMNAQNTVNRVDDSTIVDRPAVSQDTQNTVGSVVGQNVTAEQRHIDYTALEESVDYVATLQNEYVVVTNSWDQTQETYDAWANGIREYAGKLRELSDISWFVDTWFPWNPKFDNRNVHWEGYVDHSDVLTEYIPVIWVCRNDRGEILAYTKAFYSCTDELYTGGTRVYTLYGSQWLAYTDERPEGSTANVDDVLGDVYDILDRKGALPPGTNKEDFVSQGRDGEAE